MAQETRLTPSLATTLAALRTAFDVSADLVIREVTVGSHAAALVSIEGMVDRHMMADAVILPLLRLPPYADAEVLMRDIRETVLGFVDFLEADTVERLSELIMSGFAAVLIDGVATAFDVLLAAKDVCVMAAVDRHHDTVAR